MLSVHVEVLGRMHLETLTTRANIDYDTGANGHVVVGSIPAGPTGKTAMEHEASVGLHSLTVAWPADTLDLAWASDAA